LGREQTAALRELVRREVLISPAVPFLTAFCLMVAHFEGCARPVTMGTPFLNRPDRFLGTIGLFVSTCPLIVQVDEAESFLALARKVQAEFVRASAHQNYPVQNPVHRRVYDAFFNYLNVQFTSFAGRDMLAERVRSGYSNNSVSLAVRDFEASGRFTLDFEFQRRAFTPERQEEAVACVARLLDAFVGDPGRAVGAFL
ncbi:MAG TPA: condensation domain-containing protein, partial [Methylomirabilota bacterium]|nr:condensation domain-containing protein [Methylomirabilota bacterium]